MVRACKTDTSLWSDFSRGCPRLPKWAVPALLTTAVGVAGYGSSRLCRSVAVAGNTSIFDAMIVALGFIGVALTLCLCWRRVCWFYMQIAESEAMYRSVFENAHEGIFSCAPSGAILRANRALQELVGYGEDELFRMNALDVVADEDRQRIEAMMSPGLHGGEWADFEVDLMTKEGLRITVEVRAHAVNLGGLTRLDGFVRDISARVRAERAVRARDRILRGVALASNALISDPDLLSCIGRSISLLGGEIDVDRIYIFENDPSHDDVAVSAVQRYSWSRSESDPPRLPDMRYSEGFTRWRETLSTGAPIIGAVADLPETEREPFLREGIASLLVMPIGLDGAFRGFMAFGCCDRIREWTDYEVSILSAAASGLGVAIRRHRTEEALRLTVGLLRSMASSSPFGLLVADERTDEALFANHLFCAMWGLDESIERELSDGGAVPYSSLRESVEPLRDGGALCRDPHGSAIEDEVRIADGRIIHGYTTQIYGDDGCYLGRLFLFDDVTERRRMEDELRRAMSGAEAASRAKSEFLANMSHEIRTPLNGVIGVGSLLQSTRLDDRQRRYVQMITYSADLLLEIINDVLDFSKIEAGKLEVVSEPMSLQDVVEQIADTFSQRADERGLELIVSVATDLPEQVLGDAARVGQVLINLIGNAVKFTDRGQVVVSCSPIDTGDGGVTVRFEVMDSGIGIPEELRPHLFQPFTQLDTSTTRRFGGSGLGLAICKRMVTLMGGDIGIERPSEGGSLFWFTLRFGLPAEQLTGARDDICIGAGKQALVIDGNPLGRAALVERMRSMGFQVVSADDDSSALAAIGDLGERRLDVALVDMRFIAQCDPECARQISENRRVPMVAVGPTSGLPDHSQVVARGIVGYVTKPIRRSALRSVLESVLARGTSRAGHRPSAVREPSEIQRMDMARILVAEDNDINQMVIGAVLASAGYGYDIVRDGLSAVEAARGEAYDLILMDCHMPGLDGFAASDRIRESERGAGRRIPIVALTASVTTEVRERCFAHGMDGYLGKPVTSEELLSVIDEWLRRGSTPTVETPIGRTTTASDEPVDIDALVTRCAGDRGFAEETIVRYADGLPGYLEELQSALSGGDLALLASTAHRLRGASVTVGAGEVSERCAEIEAAGQEGASHEAAIGLDGLRDAIGRVVAYVEAMINTDRL